MLIVPVMPSPNGSGLQQRAFHVLTLLAGRFETEVLVACDVTEVVARPVVELPAVSVTVLPITTKVGFGKRLARWLPPLVLLRPEWSSDWPEIDAAFLPGPASGAPVALCVVFRLRMHSIARQITASRNVRKIALDLDDLESATLASIGWFALRRGRLRLASNNFSKSLQSLCLQSRVLKQYDQVYLSNPGDVNQLRAVAGGTNVLHLPNSLMPSMKTGAMPADAAMPTLLFIGTLSYFPNEDAVRWIADSILPELRCRVRMPFRIRIAGRGASVDLRKSMQSIPELEFLGEIETVEELYAGSHLALAVVRCGGGTKIKALEAAAHRCPIVGTSHAMRGLGFEQARDYLCADTAEQVAECCAALLHHPDLALDLAQRAYERVMRVSSIESDDATTNNFPFCS